MKMCFNMTFSSLSGRVIYYLLFVCFFVIGGRLFVS